MGCAVDCADGESRRYEAEDETYTGWPAGQVAVILPDKGVRGMGLGKCGKANDDNKPGGDVEVY